MQADTSPSDITILCQSANCTVHGTPRRQNWTAGPVPLSAAHRYAILFLSITCDARRVRSDGGRANALGRSAGSSAARTAPFSPDVDPRERLHLLAQPMPTPPRGTGHVHGFAEMTPVVVECRCALTTEPKRRRPSRSEACFGRSR